MKNESKNPRTSGAAALVLSIICLLLLFLCFAAGRTNLDLNNSLQTQAEATLMAQRELGVLQLETDRIRQERHEQKKQESKLLAELRETKRSKMRRAAKLKRLREHQDQLSQTGQVQ